MVAVGNQTISSKVWIVYNAFPAVPGCFEPDGFGSLFERFKSLFARLGNLPEASPK